MRLLTAALVLAAALGLAPAARADGGTIALTDTQVGDEGDTWYTVYLAGTFTLSADASDVSPPRVSVGYHAASDGGLVGCATLYDPAARTGYWTCQLTLQKGVTYGVADGTGATLLAQRADLSGYMTAGCGFTLSYP